MDEIQGLDSNESIHMSRFQMNRTHDLFRVACWGNISRKKASLIWRQNIETVSTAPSDRGRSISLLRIPYEGDKLRFIMKCMVLAEKRLR